MVICLRGYTVLPCMAMAHAEDSSPTLSEMSSTACTEIVPRRAPTSVFPPPRYNLRTSFKSLQSVATIVVGTESLKGNSQATYTIHRDLLTSASPFFAAALNGTFAEGLDQTVRLPEEKPEIFEWFMWWLYSGSLTTPIAINCTHEQHPHQRHSTLGAKHHHNHYYDNLTLHSYRHNNFSITALNDDDLRNAAGSPKYFLLLDLYSLSDKLLTSTLSNHILDTLSRLSESSNSVPTPSDTWILYDSIRDTAPMRRLILDLFAYKKTDKLLETHKDDWHPRFLRDLVVKLKRPGQEALDRHVLASWRPASWPATKACECCRELLKPSVGGERCEVCERAFCAVCLRAGKVPGVMPAAGGDVGACKPWLKGFCARYHEHGDDEC